ncbi:MAG: DUF1830 domain-containing protein [Pseudanabaena sp. ELA607]
MLQPHTIFSVDHQIIRCSYRNESHLPQIVRMRHEQTGFFERMVMPNQVIRFDAWHDALLEIHEVNFSGSIHADSVPCIHLCIAGSACPLTDNIAHAVERRQGNHGQRHINHDLLPISEIKNQVKSEAQSAFVA